jgi:hypothetical protein
VTVDAAPSLRITPVVSWPRHAEPGRRYLVTVDLALDHPTDWPYQAEEFAFGCLLDGMGRFTVEALGDTSVVLHRFGGTYGPARFLVTPRPGPGTAARLVLTFTTAGGVPLPALPLPVALDGAGDGSPAAGFAGRTDLRAVRDADPVDLGVHPAADLPDLNPKLPPLPAYVARDVDEQLRLLIRRAAPGGGAILLSGASAGTTRTLYEAVLAELPHRPLHVPRDADDLTEVALAALPPDAVVWLDRVDRLVPPDGPANLWWGGLPGADRRLFAGTLPPEALPDLADRSDAARILLSTATVVRLDATLTDAERDDALAASALDPRVEIALAGGHRDLARRITAAAELTRVWWEHPDPLVRTLLTAAVDARRLGVTEPLWGRLLWALASEYNQPGTVLQDRAYQRALVAAQEPVGSAGAPLEQVVRRDVRRAGDGDDGYLAAELLVATARLARARADVPAGAWDVFAARVSDQGALRRLAEEAAARGLDREASTLRARADEIVDEIFGQGSAADPPTDEDDPPDEPPAQRLSARDAAELARRGGEVLVIDGRPRYHLPGCVHLLGRDVEPLPVGEAVDLGFTPCGLCEPAGMLLGRAPEPPPGGPYDEFRYPDPDFDEPIPRARRLQDPPLDPTDDLPDPPPRTRFSPPPTDFTVARHAPDPPDEPPPQRVTPAQAYRAARSRDTVLVVDGRPRYHLPDCRHIATRATLSLSLAEAIQLGFTPCGLCRPLPTDATPPAGRRPRYSPLTRSTPPEERPDTFLESQLQRQTVPVRVDHTGHYHLPGCVLLPRGGATIPIGEAIGRWYVPCGLCRPITTLAVRLGLRRRPGHRWPFGRRGW